MTDKKNPPLAKYLIQAFINYLYDCGALPYVVVVVDDKEIVLPNMPAVQKPARVAVSHLEDGMQVYHGNNGQIVHLNFRTMTLNLGTEAIRDLQYGETGFSFKTRFSQVAYDIYIPYEAVINIFDYTGSPSVLINHGFMYDARRTVAVDGEVAQQAVKPTTEEPKKKTNHLSVVK